MKFSKSIQNDNEKIIELFIKTFSNSESESEGAMIGDLVYALMATIKPNDI
jgi:hypothetical protein